MVILIGFIAFNAVPTPIDPASSSSSCEEGCYDNHVGKHSGITKQEVAVTIPPEGEGEEEEERTKRRAAGGGKDVVAIGRSTKM